MDNDPSKNPEEGLRPCPFCGVNAQTENPGAGTTHAQDCPLLHMWTPMQHWNRRPIEDALRHRAEQAEASLEASEAEYDSLYADMQCLKKRAEQAERERDAFRTGWKESNAKWGEMVTDLREAEAKAFERAEAAEARVAELEAMIAEMEANRGGFTLGYVEQQQEPLKARIRELEKERDEEIAQMARENFKIIRTLEAENQKLRVLGVLDCSDCCGCLDGGAYCSDCFTRGYFTGDRKPEWRPIETAPKDGTWFLGADRYGVNEVHNTRAGWKIRGIDTKPISLTHWMPLPSAPVAP